MTIYIIRQPNGQLYVVDFSSILFDETEAKEALKGMQKTGVIKGKWEVVTFQEVSTNKEDTRFLGVDGGLRERTLQAIAKDMKAAAELRNG